MPAAFAVPGVTPPGSSGGSAGTGADKGNRSALQAAETDDTSAISYLVAWGIVLLLLMLLNRSKAGHALIYYGLALALLLLLLGNYQAITNLLAPASGQQGGGEQIGPNPVPDTNADANAVPFVPKTSPTARITAKAPSVPNLFTIGQGYSG